MEFPAPARIQTRSLRRWQTRAAMGTALLSLLALGGCARKKPNQSLVEADLRILPAETQMIGRVDLVSARAGMEWAGLLSLLTGQPPVAKALQSMRDKCGMDPLTKVDSVVVGWSGIGGTPFVVGAADFVAIVRGGFDQTKFLTCLNGQVQGARQAPNFQHNKVTVFGGDNRPFFALLEKGRLAIGSRAWILKAIDLFRRGGGAGCLDADPRLPKLIGKVDSKAPIWLVTAFSSEDAALMRASQVLPWAAAAKTLVWQVRLSAGLDATMDLEMPRVEDAKSLVGQASPLLQRSTSNPRGALDFLFSRTKVTQSSATARFKTVVSVDEVKRLVGYATSSDGCANAMVQSVRAFNPANFEDGELKLPATRKFKIPAEIRLERGNAANFEAVLSFRLKQEPIVTCRYRGGSKQAHPTLPADVELGRAYRLQSCSSSKIKAGSLTSADWAKLHLDGADDRAGRAVAQALLLCL